MADSTGAGNNRIKLGTGDDLQIYHDGSQSVIKNATGNLRIITGSTSIDLQGNDGSETLAKFQPNGAAELYYDNSKKLYTDNGGVVVNGNLYLSSADNYKAIFGAGQDLQIYHNGSHSILHTEQGNLSLSTNSGKVQLSVATGDGTSNYEKMVEANANGSVDLYYDNVKKFETKSNGAAISGKTFCYGHGLGNGESAVEVNLRSDTNQYITGLHFAGHGSINGSTYTAAKFVINGSGGTYGTITYTSGGTSYNSQSSDRRSKKNFEDWTNSVLPDFKSLKPQLFNFNLQEDGESKYKGYIAQDNVAAFPEAYPLVEDRYMFNPSGMVTYLMKAVQELNTKVETLETKVTALETELRL
jgi:hypothetical protein